MPTTDPPAGPPPPDSLPGGQLGLGPRWLPLANLTAVALVFFFYWTDRDRTFVLIRDHIQAQRQETDRLAGAVGELAAQGREANQQMARAVALLDQATRRAERAADAKAPPRP